MKKTITIAQIETVKGVENIDEILSVEGIDAVIIGPADLGISLEIYDQVMDARELEMIQKVADACRKYQKGFGIIGSLEMMKVFRQDIQLMISAIDVDLLRDGLKHYCDAYEQLGKE